MYLHKQEETLQTSGEIKLLFAILEESSTCLNKHIESYFVLGTMPNCWGNTFK